MVDSRSVLKCQACLRSGKVTVDCRLLTGIPDSQADITRKGDSENSFAIPHFTYNNNNNNNNNNNKETIKTPEAKADCFNEYFESVFTVYNGLIMVDNVLVLTLHLMTLRLGKS